MELTCSLTNPDLRFTETIKRNCRCKAKQIDKKNCEWEEPPELLMFQALFNQMLTGTWEKVNELLCGHTVYEFELEKARALFMLPEGFTKDDLAVAYDRMAKVYGNLDDSDGREMEIINKSFYLLHSQIGVADPRG